MSEATRFGHYVLVHRDDGSAQEVGRGPFGITYKAWDAELRQDVALTVITPALLSTEESRDRFLQQAQALAELHHTNVATLFHVGHTAADELFYVTELCEGPTLDQALKAEGLVPVRDALHVVLQVAKALAAAEELKLMHGDIKPANLVLIEKPGEDTIVKLVDFGLARGFAEGGRTLLALGSSGLASTAYFASPEQLEERDDIDIRSDVYSLGACFWFMLTGHPPFTGPVALAMSRTLFDDLPWKELSEQPAPVLALLESMLSRKPASRVASPTILAQEVEDYLRATEPPPPKLAQGELPLDAVKEEPVREEPIPPLAVRFQPVEEIERDAMGRVFRAIHHANNAASVRYHLIDLTLTTVPANWRELQAQITVAHEHPHPNFVNVITAETTDDGLAIVQEYVEGFSIFELLKNRGRLTPSEGLLFLQQLAPATDHAIKHGIRGFSLSKKDVFVHFPGGPGNRTYAEIIAMPLREWPSYELKADVISLGDLEALATEGGPVPETKEIGALACLACELLGGQGGRTFTACPRVTESGNAILLSASSVVDAYPSAEAFVDALRDSNGRITPASERRPVRPIPPGGRTVPTTVPTPRKARAPQPPLVPDSPPHDEPATRPQPVAARSWGLMQWLIILALLLIFVADGVGFYYFIYLPGERQRQRLADDAANQQRVLTEQELSAEQTAKAEAASEAKTELDKPKPDQPEAPAAPSTIIIPEPTAPDTTAPAPTPTSPPTPATPVSTDNAEAAAFRVKANAGDFNAARMLGLLYYDGRGVPKDYSEALKWLQVAADHGDAQAQTKLGTMYFNGWGVPKDYAQAFAWHKKAADQGNSEGLNHLGAMYAAGWGVDKDYDQALKLIKKSADQGDPDGELSLGSIYKSGIGVPKDYAQALIWFKKAADQGNAGAQSEMGILYGKGLGVKQDYSEAFICFQKAADQGDVEGLVNIGDMFQNGLGVPKDPGQALSCYQKAADQGDPTALAKLGLMYLNGVGTTKDEAKALGLFQKAADQGNAPGQNDLGDMYENGWGVAKDYEQAMNWYRKAADQGYPVAQNNIGFIYQNGWGVDKDFDQALSWYQKAADQGNAAAQNNIGCLYANGLGVKQDYDQALVWLKKSADQGDSQAMHEIGTFYSNGLGVPKDEQVAQKWYKKAILAGYSSPEPETPKIQAPPGLLTPP